MTNNTTITKDMAGKKIHVTRPFNAPAEKVWRAWTEKELLDQWWAPKPWRAETKSLDFSTGGRWLYCMVGPDGTRSWCTVDITSVTEGKAFQSSAYFSDENGNADNSFPKMHWQVSFQPDGDRTMVTVDISFDKEEDLQKIVEMGFEQGFTMALGNLDELL